MKILIPFVPHLARECLEQIGIKDSNAWPIIDRKLSLDLKIKIANKVKYLDNKALGLRKKLENKKFLINAPKSIVQKEKGSLLQYNVELKKLNSILNSIKN